MRPTMTFAWNFRTVQRALVTRRSGSPSWPISSERSTPGATRARRRPRRRRRGVSAATRHLAEESLDLVDVAVPWVAFGERPRGPAPRRPVRQGARDPGPERGGVARVVHHPVGERAVEELPGADRPAHHPGDTRGPPLPDDLPPPPPARRP